MIEAQGYFKKKVEKGAYVNLQVKYGLIRLVNTRADLCDQIKNVDLTCPLKEGETLLTKQIDLPKEIPPVCLCPSTECSELSLIPWNGSDG